MIAVVVFVSVFVMSNNVRTMSDKVKKKSDLPTTFFERGLVAGRSGDGDRTNNAPSP